MEGKVVQIVWYWHIVLFRFFAHHYGALSAFICLAFCLERFICALCEGLIQRVPTGFSLVKILLDTRLP